MIKSIRRAFSMIELILVMVVLGIVSGMSATIIAQVYENYIMQRAMHDATSRVELAASIIYNHLSNRIALATIGRNLSEPTQIMPLADITQPELYKILEWYEVASDSYNAGAWSGYCDVFSSNTAGNQISTPGSNLGLLSTIVSNTSDSTVNRMALIFNSRYFNRSTGIGVRYNGLCMGYSNTNCILKVSSVDASDNLITFDQNYNYRATEQYKLIQSAYALVPQAQDNGLFELRLHYNYQPWENTNPNSYSSSQFKVLLQNMSVFRFEGEGDTVRFKLCANEQIGTDSSGQPQYISICKEKAVIR